MDVGSSEAWAKAPPCTWSPIPPPELRGELFEDLSTNGGFVSFGICNGLSSLVCFLVHYNHPIKRWSDNIA